MPGPDGALGVHQMRAALEELPPDRFRELVHLRDEALVADVRLPGEELRDLRDAPAPPETPVTLPPATLPPVTLPPATQPIGNK